jgi:TonB family protein
MYQTSEKSTVRIAEFSAQWEGRTIDGAFPLLQFLGSGESSAVFLTTHDARNAAVKLLPADPGKEDAQLALWREASRFSNPHLIRILSFGRCELDEIPLLYVVTERAEEDLSQVLPDRSLTAVETREMLAPVLGVLEYIHRQGFVHAHLKPSNIMAVEDHLKVSADGLRRAGALGRTTPGPYDPPEAAASHAGDVWSLGVTLVEVLTQRLPSNGAVPPDLPEPFAEIARVCLKRNPPDRSTLSQISSLLTAAASPPAPRKRRYAPVGVLILLAVLVIIVVGVFIMRSDTGAPAPVSPPEVVKAPAPQTPPPTPPPAPKAEPKQAAKAAKLPEPEPPVSAPEPSRIVPASGIAEQPLPEITNQARSTIHGKVKFTVKVDVSPSGAVTEAKLDSSGASKYFADRTLAAVRQWKFEPVSINGSQVGQRWRVHFEFLRSGTKVQPQRISP